MIVWREVQNATDAATYLAVLHRNQTQYPHATEALILRHIGQPEKGYHYFIGTDTETNDQIVFCVRHLPGRLHRPIIGQIGAREGGIQTQAEWLRVFTGAPAAIKEHMRTGAMPDLRVASGQALPKYDISLIDEVAGRLLVEELEELEQADMVGTVSIGDQRFRRYELSA